MLTRLDPLKDRGLNSGNNSRPIDGSVSGSI